MAKLKNIHPGEILSEEFLSLLIFQHINLQKILKNKIALSL
jgi:plasmid maintenance system antidote protein VapI